MTHCPFTIGAGLVEGKNVICGFLRVPQDRGLPRRPSIQLAVAIFKTLNPHPDPDPLLALSGGPGVQQLASTGPIVTMANLSYFASDRDWILLDQRGVGYSQPSLNCQANETILACHNRLVSEGINLNNYTTLESAADVHDLVRALGYKQVDLEGRSYGTRLALTIMRLYPQDLHSVVLISAFPPQLNLYTILAAVTQHGFNVLFQGCATNAICNDKYPHLQTVFYQLVSKLNSKPIMLRTTDPQTNQQVSVRFSGDDLVQLIHQAQESTDLIPMLPQLIFQASQQNYTQLSQLYGNGDGFTISLGLYFSVECGEDIAYTTPQLLQASVQVLAPELRPGILASLQFDYHVCQFWGVKPVPVVQKEPVTSSVPTLIMEGEYDPITPPSNGMLTAQTLPRSYFYVFPGVTHGVKTRNLCPYETEQAFLDNPTVKPDASCISTMPEPDFQ